MRDAFAQPTGTGTASAPYPNCTKTVTTAESELAHQKYIAGKQDYDEGNYDSALRRFRDAYNLDCQKHELLIIISAAYERKGTTADKKEAVTALETYVNRAPTAPDVGTYQAKIENLKKEIAKAAPPPTAAPTSTTPPPTDTQEHSVVPWVVVGVGGVALVTGLVVLLAAPDLPTSCDKDSKKCFYREPGVNDANANPTQKSELEDRQETAGRAVTMPTIGIVTMAAGGVLVAGGLIWHFLEPTGPKETGPTAKLRPSVAPGFTGLSLGGTF